MDKYIALLRGVNVGGRHQAPMATLKKMLEGMGFANVKTLLASGNVIFEANKENLSSRAKKLEATLAKTFGFPISVLLRTKRDIERLVESQPFKGIKVTPETRLYVTFLPGKPKSAKIPKLPSKDFQVLSVTETYVCSVLRLSENKRTVDLMEALEKEFGKNITTRNWNTVEKIAKM
jgi:uncharacterized protein (DUF1697 family)